MLSENACASISALQAFALPVLRRGGGISFYRSGRAAGVLLRRQQHRRCRGGLPEDHCARLEDIHGKKMGDYDRRPVRILASRFIQLESDDRTMLFPLKRGAFIQGLLASIRDNHRVYIMDRARSEQNMRTGGRSGRDRAHCA